LPSDLIFQAVKRIRTDISKSLNAQAIEHAHTKGWINDWEQTFYYDVMRKRKMTDKQKLKKEQINQKFIRNMRRPANSS
jgi:hypothetical protein